MNFTSVIENNVSKLTKNDKKNLDLFLKVTHNP